jgi:hypothetical protein
MSFDRSVRYETAADFFELDGDAVMKLHTSAAINVCKQALPKKYVISMIEGGIWQNPGFQSSLSAIWERDPLGHDYQMANERAIEFIKYIASLENVNTFIITLENIADIAP